MFFLIYSTLNEKLTGSLIAMYINKHIQIYKSLMQRMITFAPANTDWIGLIGDQNLDTL